MYIKTCSLSSLHQLRRQPEANEVRDRASCLIMSGLPEERALNGQVLHGVVIHDCHRRAGPVSWASWIQSIISGFSALAARLGRPNPDRVRPRPVVVRCHSAPMWVAGARCVMAVMTSGHASGSQLMSASHQLRRRGGQSSRRSLIGCGRFQLPTSTGGMEMLCIGGRMIKPSRLYLLTVMHRSHQIGQLLLLVGAVPPQQVLLPPMGLGWPGQQLAQLVQLPQSLHLLHLPHVHGPAPRRGQHYMRVLSWSRSGLNSHKLDMHEIVQYFPEFNIALLNESRSASYI